MKHLLFFVKNEMNTTARTEPKIKKVVLLVILLDATVEVVELVVEDAQVLQLPFLEWDGEEQVVPAHQQAPNLCQ